VKQDEEDIVQLEQDRAFELARQARATVEEKCLLGFIRPTPVPGAEQPVVDDKE